MLCRSKLSLVYMFDSSHLAKNYASKISFLLFHFFPSIEDFFPVSASLVYTVAAEGTQRISHSVQC